MSQTSGFFSKECKAGIIVERQYIICNILYAIYYIISLQKKSQMVISIDTENTFDKIQHIFMLKLTVKIEQITTSLIISYPIILCPFSDSP